MDVPRKHVDEQSDDRRPDGYFKLRVHRGFVVNNAVPQNAVDGARKFGYFYHEISLRRRPAPPWEEMTFIVLTSRTTTDESVQGRFHFPDSLWAGGCGTTASNAEFAEHRAEGWVFGGNCQNAGQSLRYALRALR